MGAVLGEEAGSRVLDITSLLMAFQDGPLWMDAVTVDKGSTSLVIVTCPKIR